MQPLLVFMGLRDCCCRQSTAMSSELSADGAHKAPPMERHDPELVFDRDVSASIAIMAVLLGLLSVGHVPHWRDDTWCRRRPAGHHGGAQASIPRAPP
jgi:hypothetical protein